jgi:hypothetical protein
LRKESDRAESLIASLNLILRTFRNEFCDVIRNEFCDVIKWPVEVSKQPVQFEVWMMRSGVLSIVISVLAALATSAPAYGLTDSSPSSASFVSELQTAQPQKDVDENADRQGGGVAWYRRPLQLALGGAVVLVLVGFLVLMVRSAGTTVGDAGFEKRIHSLEAEIAEDSKEARSDAADRDMDEGFRDRPATRH